VWKTNDGFGNPGGPFAASGHPSAGNTYTLKQGIYAEAIGNNKAGTRTRNLYTNGTPTGLWTFPGDSLTLLTNTEIRFKQIATPATIETVNFPGVGGNPGLILNGGLLNVGDSINQVIAGSIQAAPGSQSYLCPGNNDGASVDANRAITINAAISGSGTLCIFEAGTNTAERINSTNNTYSGLWLVKAGRLLGAAPGSLGTNSSFVMDPSYVLPVPPFNSTSAVVEVTGPAILEPGYDLNSAGSLTLTNGGKIRLHQNCAFTGVVIEGTGLTAGTHPYADLVANFPNNIDVGSTAAGYITVQPYGNLPTFGPVIITQPAGQSLFAGGTAHFAVNASANGSPPLLYQWRKNGVNLTDSGNISGSTNASLTVSSVAAGDAADYDVVLTNTVSSITSTVAPLAIVAPSGETYETAVIAAHPAIFYELNDTGDPGTNNTLALDYAGGFNALYSTSVQNGNGNYNIPGPRPTDGLPGFSVGNAGVSLNNALIPSAHISCPPWNLSNNNVTITAWINPNATELASAGIVLCRSGTTVAGLNYNNSATPTLGYTWNNEYETFSWNSGITPPLNQWSFVAVVITPTTATVHMMNSSGLVSAARSYPHIMQGFNGTTLIGDDSAGANGARVFNGLIDNVAVFNRALSKTELVTLFTNASGVATSYGPVISASPTNETLYAGQTALFTVTAGGSDPLTYQWQSGPIGGPYSNLSDGGRISGSSSANLTIANINAGDQLEYVVSVANAGGTAVSGPADLTVQATGPAETITMMYPSTTTPVLQLAGADWDTGGNWSDGNPASVSAVAFPGSTYELLPQGGLNVRMRTPANPTYATFPGSILTVTGNAIWTNNPGTNGATSEIRFKQPPNQQPPNMGAVPGVVYFKKLVMNGGQLDAGNDGVVVVQGEIDILTNAPIYSDSGNDRGYRIDSWLTGNTNGTIEYHGYNSTVFNSNYVNNLNITGTSNTYSGTWNIALGTLLGSALNCLGTNNIIIGAQAAFETLYDVNNTAGNLFLSGRMYLHQNDTFHSVFINAIPLQPGTYTFAQLNAAYPTNFPATWTMQTGSSVSNASGSITVLVTPAPTIVQQPLSLSKYPTETAQFSISAQGTLPLIYQWKKNGATMADTTDGRISGSTSNVLTITNVVNADGGNYFCVVTNINGAATSQVATLTILPTGSPLNLTLDFGGAPIVQPQNTDWNTTNNWSDGNAAAISALSNPGSTYEVVPGARLRSPAGAAASTFPGVQLTIDGDGVFVNNNGPTIGELRFKHGSPGTVYFKKLRMNGGQLDTGDNGTLILSGEIDILANTPIYVDSAALQDRYYQIDSFLTGNGSIEFHAFDTSMTGGLNITCATNAYAGTWNVVQGPLLGSGLNSLGTNSIKVGVNGALETLYDLNNPKAALFLDGQMFLHQNDTFATVSVGGVVLGPGTYTFAQLNAAFPAHFPATWATLIGSSVNTGSGSVTVLQGLSLSLQVSGPNLQLTWPRGILLEADQVTGPWVTNSASSPLIFAPTAPQKFYRVQLPY
jgi:hypothetical protein